MAPLSVTITDEQRVKITVAPTTAAGTPSKLDGAVSAVVLDGNCSIEPNDATSFYVDSGTTPGVSNVLVSGDADLGAGVVTISDTIVVTVTDAQATNLGVTVGTPEPKVITPPAPAPAAASLGLKK